MRKSLVGDSEPGFTATVFFPSPDPPTTPVDVARELELPPGEIGELIISGWHVNTYQVQSLYTRQRCRVLSEGVMEKGGRRRERKREEIREEGRSLLKSCLRCYWKPLEGMVRLFKHDN